MKYSLIKIMALVLTCSLWAQGPDFYVVREQKASPQMKQKLATLREQIKTNKLQFQVGYTTAMDVPLTQLAGLKEPADLSNQTARQNVAGQELDNMDVVERDKFVKINPNKLPELTLKCMATSKTWDWRKLGKVTGVRNQLNCGSCWAFATIGAYESSYLIRNNLTIDSSEQCILNCSGIGTCGGGWWAFSYLITKGTAREVDYPYIAKDQPCKVSIPTPYKAVSWGYVSGGGIPSVAQLKQALCTYGPLAVAVRATPAFQSYTGGVFNESSPDPINHGVLLIGWDDYKGAWIIKNSWGTGWGSTAGYGTQKGYMYIKYNSNKIGYAAAWVRARCKYYILPKTFDERVKKLIPILHPKFPRKLDRQ
jgi:cathepsin L